MDEPWPVLERAVEYETGWYQGGYDLVEQPDGTTKRYYWAKLAPAVVIVPIDGDDLIFVEQYRPTIGEYHLELPAGIVQDDEDYLEAGRRELREETGYQAESVDLLQRMHIATGVLDHERGYIIAQGLSKTEPSLDENEFLTTTRISIDEVYQRVRSQPANESSITGVLLADDDGYL